MCAGALVAARVGRLVFGAADLKAGACGSLYNLCADPRLNHEVAITAGVRAEETSALLTQFFTIAGAASLSPRRDARVAESDGLENRCVARHRGFESHSLRHCDVARHRGQTNLCRVGHQGPAVMGW